MQYHDISADLFPEAPAEETLETAGRQTGRNNCSCILLLLLLLCCCRNN